jgi:hypothetical protein
VDRVGVKSTPVVVFVKDPGLEPVTYHGMNSLPSLALLILWSSCEKNSNSLRCSTQSSQGQHSLFPLYYVTASFCGLMIRNYDSLKSRHNSCMRIMFMVYGCTLGGCTQVTWTAQYFIKQWKSTKLLVMHWCIDDAENNFMKRLFYFCCHGIQKVCDDRQIVNMNEVVCGQQNKKDLGKLSFLTVWEGGWNEVHSCHSYGA